LNNLEKWIQIRKELYRQMEKQVRHRLGEDTPELMRYHKVYDSEFRKKWQASSKEDLWQQIEKSRVVLMGDFHALHQSQKAHLRILRQLPQKRPVVLAVEFFEANDQAKLDKYLAGKMSERDFLKSVQWQKRWGFPWEHYRPVVRWAQKNRIPMYGLNRSEKKKSAASLKSRDIFAGKKIAELVQTHQDAVVFVIYGDLHLANPHIPQEICKVLGPVFDKQVLRIFQNAEKVYFQLLNKDLDVTIDLVRLARNAFCLMSVAPWVKWQNYLMYLEQTYDLDLDDEEVLDYTDHISNYVKIISEELGEVVSTANLSVYTARDSHFWLQLQDHFSPSQLKWIESMIADEMSFYLPEVGVAYLARGTVNHAASLAMQFVHAHLAVADKSYFDMPADFLRQIWIAGVCYFGSKMINHKRKTDTILDLKANMASRNPTDQGKEAMGLALAQKMHELMVITGNPAHRLQTQPRRKWSYMVAANLLGGMIGERLYNGYRKDLVSSRTVMSLLKKNLSGGNFEIVYYEILELIESLPPPFQSKKEKL